MFVLMGLQLPSTCAGQHGCTAGEASCMRIAPNVASMLGQPYAYVPMHAAVSPSMRPCPHHTALPPPQVWPLPLLLACRAQTSSWNLLALLVARPLVRWQLPAGLAWVVTRRRRSLVRSARRHVARRRVAGRRATGPRSREVGGAG